MLARWKASSYFLAGLLLLYIAFFLPFWRSILLGFVFASSCSPMLNRLRKNLHTRRSSAAYVIVGASIITVVSLATVVAVNIYSFIYNFIHNQDNFAALSDRISHIRDQLINWVDTGTWFTSTQAREKITDSLAALALQAQNFLVEGMRTLLRQSPQIFLGTTVFLLTFAGFLIAGPKVWRLFARLFDLSSDHRDRYVEFEKICARTIGSHILVGGAQATVVTLGAMATGTGSPVLIWFAAFCFAMIPLIGASTVAFSLALVAFLDGDGARALVLVGTGLASGTVEALARVWIFSKVSRASPILSFISLMGAITLFGFVGLVIAPVVEALVMAWVIREDDRDEEFVFEPERSRADPIFIETTGGPS